MKRVIKYNLIVFIAHSRMAMMKDVLHSWVNYQAQRHVWGCNSDVQYTQWCIWIHGSNRTKSNIIHSPGLCILGNLSGAQIIARLSWCREKNCKMSMNWYSISHDSNLSCLSTKDEVTIFNRFLYLEIVQGMPWGTHWVYPLASMTSAYYAHRDSRCNNYRQGHQHIPCFPIQHITILRKASSWSCCHAPITLHEDGHPLTWKQVLGSHWKSNSHHFDAL